MMRSAGVVSGTKILNLKGSVNVYINRFKAEILLRVKFRIKG